MNPINDIWIPKEKVNLKQGLSLLISNNGEGVFLSPNFSNMLCDFIDFSDCKAAHSIIREFCYNNVFESLLNSSTPKDRLRQLDNLKLRAVDDFGFNERNVEYVVEAIASALGVVSSYGANPIDDAGTDNTTEANAQTHITFWGQPLGQSYHIFKGFLEKRDYTYSRYNDPETKEHHFGAIGKTRMFLGYGSGIHVFESPYSGKVYKIEVYLSKILVKSIDIYRELKPLLEEKYGTPVKDDNVETRGWRMGNGVKFNLPGGSISLVCGHEGYTGDGIWLIYEDMTTYNTISDELPKYASELKRKKEMADDVYKRSLINDL